MYVFYMHQHLTLTDSVSVYGSPYFISVLPLPQWALDILNHQCRGFVWKGEGEVNGGHLLLLWTRVCQQAENGGLGMLNLKLFGTALRCCWKWLRWASEMCPWALIPVENDLDSEALFRAAADIRVGDGTRATLWTDAWLHGEKSVQEVSPFMHSFVKKSNITVAAAL
jgi:hypothetical protein